MPLGLLMTPIIGRVVQTIVGLMTNFAFTTVLLLLNSGHGSQKRVLAQDVIEKRR